MKYLRQALIFIFVCLCGAFVAMAGGVEWGTEEMGVIALCSIGFGIIGAIVTIEGKL